MFRFLIADNGHDQLNTRKGKGKLELGARFRYFEQFVPPPSRLLTRKQLALKNILPHSEASIEICESVLEVSILEYMAGGLIVDYEITEK